MNKQELIERMEGLKNLFGNKAEYIEIDMVIRSISELDEPQKVQVPQFVADWYEKNKDDFETKLFNAIDLLLRDLEDDELSEFEEWILDEHTASFQILVNMHQFGYEVEKEKRYYVRLKGVDENYNYLNCIKHLNAWALTEIKTDKKFRTTHTRKELADAGFGWVFDCPGIEIEEVEE